MDGKRSVATGKWASEVADLLVQGGVTCATLPRGPYTAQLIEKVLWASLLWLVCHKHGGITVRCPAAHTPAGLVAASSDDSRALGRVCD